MRIHSVQHVAFEGLGHIAKWIDGHNHSLTLTRMYAGEPLPDPAEFDWLVFMGGPMNIYEDVRYPWLAEERAFIRRSIAAGKSAVGICLGAQLLADALGSKVYRGTDKEIGWMPIQITEEGRSCDYLAGVASEQVVFHWHGDTFDIPEGAVHLARSKGCNSQAFLYENRILGLQFHLESTSDTVREILAHCSDELVDGPYIQNDEQIRSADPALFASINNLLETLLNRLAEVG